jgi:hypothetical protein
VGSVNNLIERLSRDEAGLNNALRSITEAAQRPRAHSPAMQLLLEEEGKWAAVHMQQLEAVAKGLDSVDSLQHHHLLLGDTLDLEAEHKLYLRLRADKTNKPGVAHLVKSRPVSPTEGKGKLGRGQAGSASAAAKPGRPGSATGGGGRGSQADAQDSGCPAPRKGAQGSSYMPLSTDREDSTAVAEAAADMDVVRARALSKALLNPMSYQARRAEHERWLVQNAKMDELAKAGKRMGFGKSRPLSAGLFPRGGQK